MSDDTPCGPYRWGCRWSSLRGHKRAKDVPTSPGRRHADPATGASAGASSGATKLVRCVPKCAGGGFADSAIGAVGGGPFGATKRARCAPSQKHVERIGKERKRRVDGGREEERVRDALDDVGSRRGPQSTPEGLEKCVLNECGPRGILGRFRGPMQPYRGGTEAYCKQVRDRHCPIWAILCCLVR